MRLIEQHGGSSTVLTLGPPEAEEQLRDMMAIGDRSRRPPVTDGAGVGSTGDRGRDRRRRSRTEPRAVRPDPVRQRVGRRRQLPGGDPRRAQARAPVRHRRQGDHDPRWPACARAGGPGRARHLRGPNARGGHASRRAQPAALSIGPGPPPRQAQAARGLDPGTARTAPRDGPPHPAARLGKQTEVLGNGADAAPAVVDVLDS